MGCLALTYDPRETLPLIVWRNEEKLRTKEKRRKAPDARYYDPALGRFTTVDPKASQFAAMSPYLGMGANPNMYVDPDGQELTTLAAIAIAAAVGGGVGAASYGISTAISGSSWDWGDFGISFGIGAAAAAAGVGATAAVSGSSFAGIVSGTASAGLGATVAGGAVGGAISGGLNAGIYGGNIGAGIWQGALGGAIGGMVPSVGVEGILPGMAVGAVGGALGGGLAGGTLSAINGGSFGEGFGQGAKNGALGGALSGGIYGGIRAFERRKTINLYSDAKTSPGPLTASTDMSYQEPLKHHSTDVFNNGQNGSSKNFKIDGGQHVRVKIKNLNLAGVQGNIQDQSLYTYKKNFWSDLFGTRGYKVYLGDSYNFTILPSQSVAYNFYRFNYTPMNWTFSISSSSDVALMRVDFYTN